ncbi:MAG: hypothetical protein KTR31_16770 [Myxococcales bacterium]|nr:hypothetical protein [Myxococcales bacterium]
MRIVWVTSTLLGCTGPTETDTDTTTASGEEFAVLGDDASLPAAALLSVWGPGPSDLWMVGSDDGAGPVVLHLEQGAWSRIDVDSPGDLWWVWSSGSDRVWMAGDGGRVVTYDRATGTSETTVITNTAYKLFGLWGTSDTDVYAVGGDINGNLDGVVLHYDGAKWSEVATASPGEQVTVRSAFKVAGSGPDDVWVVGTGALIMHWDGATWEDVEAPLFGSTPLTTVHASGPDEAIAVGGFGNAAVTRFDGTDWTDDSPPPQAVAPFFNGVFTTTDRGVVACGGNGSIFWRRSDEWTLDPRPRPTAHDFHACLLDDAGDVWAVGGDLTGLSEGVVVYGGSDAPDISL